MRLRQEQVVFLATLAILGLLSWTLLAGGDAGRRGRTGSEEKPFTDHRAPRVEVVQPNDAAPALRRAIFAPPRDTAPLPPLQLVEPERDPLPRLAPPPAPGPAPRVYGQLLRTDRPTVEVADLFAALDEPADLVDEAFFEEQDGEEQPRGSLIAAVAEAEDPGDEESYADRVARLESYKDRYDWLVQVEGGEPIFGRIENEDRYGLAVDPARSSEPILFTRIDPLTGREHYANLGDARIAHQRDAVFEFHFARTVANDIELRRLRLGGALTRGSYDEALQLADACVRQRLEAPRALAIAEELYQRCAAFDPDDPAPLLGLASCYEAGFELERAFRQYQDLLARFEHRPEIHVRLARLEARFLLHDQAEARLREALARNRGSWEVRWGLGRFLLERGRPEEAAEHLRQASRLAPQEPERLHVRVAIRTDLGAAQLALGEVQEAGQSFRSAIHADATHERALAGLLATGLVGGAVGDDDVAPVATAEARGFELLLARGLRALQAGAWEDARDQLLAAAEADPLHAARALGALSHLADVTGHPEDALRYADEALEVDPADPYALFQRGRLLGLAEDYEGARAALLAALEVELDFEDALVALGDMAFRLGRFEDAERYLERAVSIDPSRAEVFDLRGLNFLRLGRAEPAREAFEAARDLDGGDPVALGGLAWCHYLAGDLTEALIQLGNLQETAAKQPGGERHAEWALQQVERIRDHTEKVAWSDNFNRKRLLNEWVTHEGAGPEVSMVDGAVRVEGVFRGNGRTTVYRTYNPGDFVSFEADVRISAQSNVRAGVFLAREQQRRNAEPELTLEASISRHKDGPLQVRLQRAGQTPEVVDMAQQLPTDRWVRLRIERTGEGSDSTVSLSMDGVPVLEGASLPGLGRATSEVLVGLFVEGENSRQVAVEMDNAQVVFRQR